MNGYPRPVDLQNDRNLYRAKLVAGALSVVALVGLFITSLNRGPNPFYTVVVGVVVVGVAAAIGLGVARRRRRDRQLP